MRKTGPGFGRVLGFADGYADGFGMLHARRRPRTRERVRTRAPARQLDYFAGRKSSRRAIPVWAPGFFSSSTVIGCFSIFTTTGVRPREGPFTLAMDQGTELTLSCSAPPATV